MIRTIESLLKFAIERIDDPELARNPRQWLKSWKSIPLEPHEALATFLEALQQAHAASQANKSAPGEAEIQRGIHARYLGDTSFDLQLSLIQAARQQDPEAVHAASNLSGRSELAEAVLIATAGLIRATEAEGDARWEIVFDARRRIGETILRPYAASVLVLLRGLAPSAGKERTHSVKELLLGQEIGQARDLLKQSSMTAYRQYTSLLDEVDVYIRNAGAHDGWRPIDKEWVEVDNNGRVETLSFDMLYNKGARLIHVGGIMFPDAFLA